MTAERSRSGSGDGDRPDRPIRRASRRGVLAVGAAGLLAGCLVTSEEEGSDARQTSDGANGSDADGDEGGSGSGGDAGSDGGESEGEATPDEVGPDGSGLVVTDATVREVTEGGGWTRVRARLTVRNAGRFEYGTVEFRADAYAVSPGTDEREPVGFGYVTRRFSPDDRFGEGRSRSFDVTIRFESDETPVRPERDRYAVDAAVRRAEPL
ncbi:hypothetical protein DVK05_07170 [Halorubrum sp. Atlit-8R]|uniref:hypothetical protein n=1 Tax=unclassified Halorubrum TaxID=2642239 RepID=UPI000EF2549D|nr:MULTISPECIES: hypothetical protein [unclassified Halorubrum]RLM67006.1 hypothetical protein DVK08_14190 [Halorubrum sp. Atlit-9R]RLM81830.1 hypothetical protein DVK05_07170 [Halorubrum sp. Atlit-8R]